MPQPMRSNWSASCLAAVTICFVLSGLSACGKSQETRPPQTPPPAAPKAPPPATPPAAPPAAPQAAAFQVIRVDLGNAIGADKKVATPGVTFKPGDTIFASVLSEGASPNVALTARWTFEDGQLVNEATQNISTTGPAVTEFHIAKPDGWPEGKYKLEISAGGKPARVTEFSVVK